MNKKNIIIHAIAIIVLLAILIVAYMVMNPKGDYKEGTYLGSAGLHTAVVYVNQNGMIKSVFIDEAYLQYNADGTCKNSKVSYSGKTECISTTKQILQDEYAMKPASDIEKEWFEQVNALSDKIVEEQGTAWLNLKEDGTTDSISSVTIIIDETVKAVENALKQAKK